MEDKKKNTKKSSNSKKQGNNTKNPSNNTKSPNNNKKNSSSGKNNKNLNNNKKSTKNSKINNDLFDKTDSFDIIIDAERLKDKESLDFSFIDNKRKKKKAKKDIEILEDVNYTEELKKMDFPDKKNSKGDVFSSILLILFSFVLGFLVCFIWSRESDYFVSTEKVIEEKIIKEIVVDDNIVFVGDSIFDRYDLDKFYNGMPIINSGVSGNKTIDVLNNMNERIYRYNPSKVILMIGTNDFVSISNDDTVKNIGKIIDGIKENRPYTKIFVQSIYPVNKNINNGIDVGGRDKGNIKSMNEGIKRICEEKNVSYMNIHDLLIDDDGNLKEEYTNDGLHLTDSAYKVITEEVMKVLKN